MKTLIRNLLLEILKNSDLSDKTKLLGKEFFHGTVLESWKNSDGNEYLFVVNEFEAAKSHAVDRADAMVREYGKSVTAIVVKLIITNEIINFDWEVDDDLGNWSREPFNYKVWQDSYNAVGSFVIQGKYDIGNFPIVFKETFTI